MLNTNSFSRGVLQDRDDAADYIIDCRPIGNFIFCRGIPPNILEMLAITHNLEDPALFLDAPP